MVLAPHPDDETIGCAGVIQQALKAGARVRVAYLTNGEHNELAFIVYEKRLIFKQGGFIHMGELRRKEAIKAMESLGLSDRDLTFLGYPDFGSFILFSRYWDTERPLKDMLTRISSVPYKENLSYGAPYFAENALADLKRLLTAFRPNKIFVSHPADSNGDHKAFYLFLQVALHDLEGQFPAPKVYPYLVHCVGWPMPRHYHSELDLLPPKSFAKEDIGWTRLDLTPEQLEKKRQAILSYRTQTRVSAFYLLAFGRQNELFGDYPLVELLNQPAAGSGQTRYFGLSHMLQDEEEKQEIETVELKEARGVSYAVSGGFFLVKIDKSQELDYKFRSNIYLFGYSRSRPFAKMPKIRIITKHKLFKVFDKKKLIHPDGVSLELNGDSLLLKVPLAFLGDPDLLLVSVRASKGVIPVQTAAFRLIELN